MANPVTELASLDLDELWRRVYEAKTPDEPTLEAFIMRLREAHALHKSKEKDKEK